MKVENDGNTARQFVLRSGEGEGEGWTITYHAGVEDITSQMLSVAGYTAVEIAPGESRVITVGMTPNTGVAARSLKSVTISLRFSTSDAAAQDSVSATSSLHRPDLLVKRTAEPVENYALDNVYQTTPSGDQVETFTVSPTNPVSSFELKVENDGNTPTAYTLKADETPDAGWTLRYLVAGTGVTAAITGPGYTTPELPPGGTLIIEVQMAAGAGVTPGATKTTIVKVFADALGTAILDAVRATTAASQEAPPTVTSVKPTSGLNNQAKLTVQIAGRSFKRGAVVRLERTGQADITATNVSGNMLGNSISGNMNLTGAAPGKWNVVVINPDGQFDELTEGFTVIDAASVVRDAAVVNLVASPDPAQHGRPVAFQYTVTNLGNVAEGGLAVTLTSDGKPLGRPQAVPMLAPGQNHVGGMRLDIPRNATPGDYLVTATVTVSPGEANSANNSQTVQVTVRYTRYG